MASLVSVGCIDATEPSGWKFETSEQSDVGIEDTSRRTDPQFAGLWRIDQPTHATYEAALYNFRADGTVILVDTLSVGGKPAEVGTLSNCRKPGESDAQCRCNDQNDEMVSCRIADSWWSAGPQTIAMLGTCTDGQSRTMRINYDTDQTSGVEVVDVDGETHWCHAGFQWRWEPCATEACLDF
jgi:hypothetical protein